MVFRLPVGKRLIENVQGQAFDQFGNQSFFHITQVLSRGKVRELRKGVVPGIFRVFGALVIDLDGDGKSVLGSGLVSADGHRTHVIPLYGAAELEVAVVSNQIEVGLAVEAVFELLGEILSQGWQDNAGVVFKQFYRNGIQAGFELSSGKIVYPAGRDEEQQNQGP